MGGDGLVAGVGDPIVSGQDRNHPLLGKCKTEIHQDKPPQAAIRCVDALSNFGTCYRSCSTAVDIKSYRLDVIDMLTKETVL